MPEKEKPSTFITVIAWIFIVLGGFATFMTALQNIMIFFFIPPVEMKKGITNPQTLQGG